MKFILDFIPRSTRSGSARASTLDHEVRNNPMEDQSVIEAFLCELDEISSSDRSLLLIQ